MITDSGESEINVEADGSFIMHLEPNSELRIRPQPIDSESSLLFYPSERPIKVRQTCLLNSSTLSFEARNGLVFQGRSEPKIEEAEIIVKTKAGKEVLREVSKDGTFKLRPLYDTEEYELTMEKEGYQFV